MGRGALTDKVQRIANSFLKRNMTLSELRLIPYIHFVMTNSQKLDNRKISDTEREILKMWQDAGYAKHGNKPEDIRVTKQFWNFMCDVLFCSYVDYKEEK